MKTIYLFRHGKAVSRFSDIVDFDRDLIERGQNDVLQVAERLKAQNIKPAIIFTSPSKRALQTARIAAKELKYRQKDIRYRKAIYDQEDGSLLAVIKRVENKHDSIMLVGHNPSIDYFAQYLISDFSKSIPTSCVVGVELDIDKWSEVSYGQGRLKLFDYPHKVKVTRKSMTKDIEKRLTEQIVNVLDSVDSNAKDKMEKSLKKISSKIAEKFVKILRKNSGKKGKK